MLTQKIPPQYAAKVAALREVLAKLEELDALLTDAAYDEELGRSVERLQQRFTSKLREAELGLWEQSGYPTMPRGRR